MYKPQTGQWGQNARMEASTSYRETFKGDQLSPSERQGLAHKPVPLRRTEADPEVFKSTYKAVLDSTPRGERSEIHKPFRGTAGAGVPLNAQSHYDEDFKESPEVKRNLRHNPEFTKPSNMHTVKPDDGQYKSTYKAVLESTPRGERSEIHKPFRGTAGAGVPLGAESGYDKDYVVLPPISPRGTRHSPEHGGNRAVPNGMAQSSKLKDVLSEYDNANLTMLSAKPPKGKAPYFES